MRITWTEHVTNRKILRPTEVTKKLITFRKRESRILRTPEKRRSGDCKTYRTPRREMKQKKLVIYLIRLSKCMEEQETKRRL